MHRRSIDSSGGASRFPGLAYYYDNQFVGQCFQDTAATTPSASGEVVGAWLDRKGGKNAIQATAGKKPLNRTTSGIEFDTTDDALVASGVATVPTTGFTVYVGFNPDVINAVKILFVWGNNSGGFSAYQIATGAIEFAHAGLAGIGSSPGSQVIASSYNVVGIRYNATTGAYRMIINGNAAITGTSAKALAGSGLQIGIQNASFPFDGKILRLAVYTSEHSDSVMGAAMTFFRGIA